jgi:hypothetical protein
MIVDGWVIPESRRSCSRPAGKTRSTLVGRTRDEYFFNARHVAQRNAGCWDLPTNT